MPRKLFELSDVSVERLEWLQVVVGERLGIGEMNQRQVVELALFALCQEYSDDTKAQMPQRESDLPGEATPGESPPPPEVRLVGFHPYPEDPAVSGPEGGPRQ